MNIDWEVVAAVAIIAVMLWIARGQGRSNPVSTGKLQQDVHTTKNKLMVLEKQMESVATQEDISKLRKEMVGHATSDQVAAVKTEVAVVCEKVVGIEKSAERTAEGVKRLEHYFLKKGIGRE